LKPTDPAPNTSPSLLLRIRDPKDGESWQTFQEIYAPIIQAYCRRKGIQAADTDDVVQEVLMSVAKSIRNFEYSPEKGQFRAWMGTITANKLKSYLSKRSNRPSPELSSGIIADLAGPDADSEWVEVFSRHIFLSACTRVRASLEPVTWQSFEATWIQRRPATEVAESLGIPVHSVYVNKSRVLKRLEEEVKQLADDSPFINSETQVP
jgi:RNA polymerase sigma factor (sigma-70 family)